MGLSILNYTLALDIALCYALPEGAEMKIFFFFFLKYHIKCPYVTDISEIGDC